MSQKQFIIKTIHSPKNQLDKQAKGQPDVHVQEFH